MIKQLSLSYLQVAPNYLLFNIGKLFSGLDILRRPEKSAAARLILPTTPSGLVRPGRTRDRK